MPIGGERAAVQNPFIRYAQEAGWTYMTPERALDRRRGITSPVLDSVLLDQLQKLNPASSITSRRSRFGTGWCGCGPTSRAIWTPGNT
ncbi:MAG: hypothetical protein ACLFUU_08565 [Desulfobacteraceae bacterium]